VGKINGASYYFDLLTDITGSTNYQECSEQTPYFLT